MKIIIQTLFFFLLANQICLTQWVQIGFGNESIIDIEVKDADIFVITSDSGAVFHSTDTGFSWNKIIDANANDIDIHQSGTLLLVKDDSLFYSSNNGEDWINTNIIEQIIDSLPSQFLGASCRKIFISPIGTIFCYFHYSAFICSYDGFASSTDNGLNWTTLTYNFIHKAGKFFAFRNEFVLTGGFSYCIGGGGHASWLSSDFGNTWQLASIPAGIFVEFFSNGNIIADANYMSTDTCNSWTRIDTLNYCNVGMSVSNGSSEYLLVGTGDSGVILYSDEGDKIGEINEGLTNLNIQSLEADNNGYIYAGTENGLWRRPVSEITSIEEVSVSIPSNYILYQNYPNPFNPSTKIQYSIPQSGNVVIKVFDILGSEIETLVNEEKPTGSYEITWYAENLPSGVYFYQLKAVPSGRQAGSFIETKKMILLK